MKLKRIDLKEHYGRETSFFVIPEKDLIDYLDGEIARIQKKLDEAKYATERVYEGGRLKALKDLRKQLEGGKT